MATKTSKFQRVILLTSFKKSYKMYLFINVLTLKLITNPQPLL